MRHGGKLEVLVAHDDLPDNDFEELLQMVTDPATTYVPQVRQSPGTRHPPCSFCLASGSTINQFNRTANLPPSGPCQPPGRVPHVHRPQLLRARAALCKRRSGLLLHHAAVVSPHVSPLP